MQLQPSVASFTAQSSTQCNSLKWKKNYFKAKIKAHSFSVPYKYFAGSRMQITLCLLNTTDLQQKFGC